jgi:hypothetical protein
MAAKHELRKHGYVRNERGMGSESMTSGSMIDGSMVNESINYDSMKKRSITSGAWSA